MSYKVNGKVYTSHPLMDEIVYYCKTVLKGIVLKNEKKANEFETADSLSESDAFLAIKNKSISLPIFPTTEEFLMIHGFSRFDAIQMTRNYELLPEYVDCVLSKYNDNNTAPVEWNAKEGRYEYLNGNIAGRNINKQVFLQDGKFVYSDGTECTNIVIPFINDYYVDNDGNLITYDEETEKYHYLLDGSEVHTTVIECQAGIFQEFANDYYVDEKNFYYRTLTGLPAYDTTEYNVYLDVDEYGYLLELDDSEIDFNFALPLHEYSLDQIITLDSLGILDYIIEEYYTNAESNNKPYYKYLNYLGTKKIDLYNARIAKEWDILYLPPGERIISDVFKEKYTINRDIYYRRTYQQAYSIYSDYYEEMCMIMILCQTYTDMVTDTPEFYIRRDIFDLRSVKYFLEANGVAFYKEIPMRYQILIVKNLNKLIKYKSTIKNINDILTIFSMEDAIVYKYFLYKRFKYNRYEREANEEDDGLEDTAFWEDSETVVNGNFRTGDTSGWNITSEIERSNNPLRDDTGYRVNVDEFSEDNVSPYLYIWNKTTDAKEFCMEQAIEDIFPAGDYKIRIRCCGTHKIRNGLYVYINDVIVDKPITTTGDSINDWEYYYSPSFSVDGQTQFTIKLDGAIPGGYNLRIDDISILFYTDIVECGDENEIDGIIPVNSGDVWNFIDESSEENYTRDFIYDFGNEDSDVINPGAINDTEFDYNESLRTIYDEAGNVYDLEFVKVPLEETYDDYIKDNIHRKDYDVIVEQDDYWDGEDVHNYVKNLHLEKEFTIEGTKYLDLEFVIPYQEYSYQRQYYLSMFMNSNMDTTDLRIPVPSIKEYAKFKLSDLFLFIYCCNSIYDNQDIDIIDPTGLFERKYDKPDFEPFLVIDGGHAWDGIDVNESEEPDDEPTGDSSWETPDIDCGEITPKSKKDKEYDEILDFGFNTTIDYKDPDLIIYDYGEEIAGEATPEEENADLKEPPIWPMQDLADYGDEDLAFDEEDSIAVVRTKYTKIVDYGDEDAEPSDLSDTPYIFDYNASTAGSVSQIIMPVFTNTKLDFGDEDAPPATGISDYEEVYDFGDDSNSLQIIKPKEYLYDFGEISEDDDPSSSIDTMDYADYYQPYYIQNADLSLLRLYEYDSEMEGYILVYDYSNAGVIPDIPVSYDIEIVLTIKNYNTYLRHWIINSSNTETIQLTKDNYTEYLNSILYLYYPWHYEVPQAYTQIIDGHRVQEDSEDDDVYFDGMSWFKIKDNTPAVGKVNVIDDTYKQMYDGGKTIYTLDSTEMAYYDWLRYTDPNLWVKITGRIYAFNMDVDLNEVATNIGIRHSTFGWAHGYTLEDCGVGDFIVQKKFNNIQELYNVYDTNTKCYYNLIKKIEECNTRDEYQVYTYVFNQLYTKRYDQDMYRLKSGDIATSYDQILKERSFTLYKFYIDLMNENDVEVRIDRVRQILNDLVDTLSYYISADNLKYVLTFISTNSVESTMRYMMLILNFFKSWKVYFLDPHATMIMNDKFNHMVISGDTITEAKTSVWNSETMVPRDTIDMTIKYTAEEFNDLMENGNGHNTAMAVESYGHYVDENVIGDKVHDGNHPDDCEDVIDGGNNANEPYYVIDGGRVSARHISTEIDGGGSGLLDKQDYIKGLKENPDIKYVNLPVPEDDDHCIYLDGNKNKLHKDYEFVVDGGTSLTRKITTPTAITTVDDKNYLSVDVRVSPCIDNGLTMTEDGLLFENKYTTNTDMTELYNTLRELRDDNIQLCNDLTNTLIAYGSVEGAARIINAIYSDLFTGSEHCIKRLNSSTYENYVNNTINSAVEDYTQWFNNINPFNNFTKVE